MIRVIMIIIMLFVSAACRQSGNVCSDAIKSKDYDRAIAVCTQMLNESMSLEKRAITYNLRGFAYSEKGVYDQAIADFTESTKVNPSYEVAYSNRGIQYSYIGLNDQAIVDLTRAIELNPSYANAYNSRGIVYGDKGLYNQAVADLTRAIELNPSFTIAYDSRGNLYSSQGLFDKAISDYSKAIESDPTYEYAYLNRLVAIWLSKKNDTVAVNELRMFVSARRSNEWVRTISKYYLGNNELSEQTVFAEAKNGKNDKEIKERLCEAYFYLGIKRLAKGERAGATEYFNKSIEIDAKASDGHRQSKAMLTLMRRGTI